MCSVDAIRESYSLNRQPLTLFTGVLIDASCKTESNAEDGSKKAGCAQGRQGVDGCGDGHAENSLQDSVSD